nr:hypothetical protein [Verrucomicrobium spinosum]
MKGRWKLYLPHSYRTLNGRPGGKDGVPAPYEQRTLEKAELYDVVSDISERTDLGAANPEVVAELEKLAEDMRQIWVIRSPSVRPTVLVWREKSSEGLGSLTELSQTAVNQKEGCRYIG